MVRQSSAADRVRLVYDCDAAFAERIVGPFRVFKRLA